MHYQQSSQLVLRFRSWGFLRTYEAPLTDSAIVLFLYLMEQVDIMDVYIDGSILWLSLNSFGDPQSSTFFSFVIGIFDWPGITSDTQAIGKMLGKLLRTWRMYWEPVENFMGTKNSTSPPSPNKKKFDHHVCKLPHLIACKKFLCRVLCHLWPRLIRGINYVFIL
jgi:hypothetical protein